MLVQASSLGLCERTRIERFEHHARVDIDSRPARCSWKACVEHYLICLCVPESKSLAGSGLVAAAHLDKGAHDLGSDLAEFIE